VGPEGSRLTIYIDGEKAFTVSEKVAGELGLRVGQTLSGHQTDTLRAEESDEKIREAALRLLSVRARSRGELLDRLRRKGFDDDAVRVVIESLSAVGLVDDEAFARAWADERARLRPVGPRRLARELVGKRVSAELAARVTDEVFSGQTELELARKALAPKIRAGLRRAGEDDRSRRRRLYAFLVRRGFSYEIAARVIDEAETELGPRSDAVERSETEAEGETDV
jgi:regulatory protein